MRCNLGAAVLLLAVPLLSQPQESSELRKAREDADKVRELVEAGALPRRALEEAELVLNEAWDEETLRQTLYGEVELADLSPEQADSMLSAANSLVERQLTELERAEELAREGVLPSEQLEPYRAELARRRKTLRLAQDRADLFEELVEAARLEKELAEALRQGPEKARRIAEKFDGTGVFLASQLRMIELQFLRRFGRALPISASGDTALHRSMGFDHTGCVDVALHPDSEEGSWLKSLLEELRVPYFAFRGAVAGKSTGAHIHIGPPSPRINRAN